MKKIIFVVILVLLTVGAFSQQLLEDDYLGVWVRKFPQGEEVNPILYDFLIIEKMDNNFLVLTINTRVEGDHVLSNSYYHFYAQENDHLISKGTRYSSVSELRLFPSGDLVEVINNPSVGEEGENVYIRPTIADFQTFIDWYGYELN